METYRTYDNEALFSSIELDIVDTKNHANAIPQNGNAEKQRHDTDMTEYDPYENRVVLRPTTYRNSLAHMLKASLGIGILAMPLAFKNAGFVIGFLGTGVVGILCIITMHLLINSCYELCKRKRIPCMTYAETTKEAFLNGPESLRKFAVAAGHMTNVFLVLYQIGSSCTYLVFMAVNVKEIVDIYIGNFMTTKWYKVALLIPLILISWVRDLKLLSPFSTIATGMTIASFGIIFGYILNEPLSFAGREQFGQLEAIPLFFSTVLFAMEAIGVVLPLEQEMMKPIQFSSRYGVLNMALIPITILYAFLGIAGYLKYGENIQNTVNLNLPQNVMSTIVNLMLCSSIFVCYALSNYVAFDILWKNVELYYNKIAHKTLWEYTVRTVIVLFTFFFSMVVPDIDLVINLTGAMCLSIVGVALPAIINHLTFYNERRMQGRWAYFLFCLKNIFIVLVGISAMFIGTTTSMKDIINKMYNIKS